jgi:hypothetical protein
VSGADRSRRWRSRQGRRDRRIVLRVEVYETTFIDWLIEHGRLTDFEVPTRQRLSSEVETILQVAMKNRDASRGASLRRVNLRHSRNGTDG